MYDALILQMGHTLAQFQLIEEWMKAYIEIAFRIIRKELPDDVAFRFSAADYEDAPLGTLLIVFKKLNSNEALHADLGTIKKERDFIAHKAATQIEFTNGPENTALLARLTELEKAANALFHRVGDEVDKLKFRELKNT